MLLENTFISAADAETNHPLIILKLKKSLQAQPAGNFHCMRKRASCFASCEGSATVEAALLIPAFLCAVCVMIMMGQLLIAEGEIQHAVAKTAMICARQESVKTNGDRMTKASDYIDINAAFYSVFQGGDLCTGCIVGGRQGVALSINRTSAPEGKVSVNAVYALKIPVPFFQGLQTVRTIRADRRVYKGFIPRKGLFDEDDRIVYITEHGSVYHTSLSCSHISLRIKGNSLAIKMLEARGVRRCKKCIKKNIIPQAIYITAAGDCYHSTVSCSGLKRAVRAVRLSEVRGMRMCSRCAAKSGK